jgi:hypothetical protein
MKISLKKSGSLRGVLSVVVSIIVAFVPLTQVSVFAFSGETHQDQTPQALPQGHGEVYAVTAIASEEGVLLQWGSNLEVDNLGFNVYRWKDGRCTRINREIVPGSVFVIGAKTQLQGGYSYSFFDPAGIWDSTYYIESVSVFGKLRLHESVTPVLEGKVSAFKHDPALGKLAAGGAASARTEAAGYFEKQYPAAPNGPTSLNGQIEDQWAVAAQPGLKIYIKKDGWYRVTQQQMVGAGFNPTVDVRNLMLFADGQEVAIRTSTSADQFSSGDYFEFYGRGLDTPTSNTRTYYLIAGAAQGKRILGELQLDSTSMPPLPSVPQAGPSPFGFLPTQWFGWIFSFLNGLESPTNNLTERPTRTGVAIPVKAYPADNSTETKQWEEKEAAPPVADSEPNVVAPLKVIAPNISAADISAAEKPREVKGAVSTSPERESKKGSGRKTKRKRKSKAKREYSHAAVNAAAGASSFDYTVERQDRLFYVGNALNGDAENFFGQVISSSPVTQTVTTPNPDLNADGPAKLEIALQGILNPSFFTHQIRVELNDIPVATLNYSGVEHLVQPINIPVTQLRDGPNTIKFTRTSTGDVSLVDYVRLTYPHTFRADNNSLWFSLRSTQSARVEGFVTQNVSLIDYTDPFSVRVIRPIVETSGSAYAINVPPSPVRTKSRRLLFAIPENQFDAPAGFSFNQPSTLNLNTNGADLLIISHKTLTASADPLASLRQSQGMTVSVVDVEDIYDEFSYGVHGPQAIKAFLSRAAISWVKAPRYVIFLGDASLDPRNYTGSGDFDLVPTKLVDATFNETASDDWLTDFDNDGIADIPVGRLPARSVAEADVVISKIVNFDPANVPQSALFVADTQGSYYFNFEQANTDLQALLPSSMTVETVNRRTEPSDAVAKVDVVNKFNQGQALVNFSGHGNVNTWTGGNIFTSTAARASTNGNKLPFVVVMDCLNGYFQDPNLEGLAEALLKAPNGGAVAAFASSGLTIPDGPHEMGRQLFILLYGSSSIALGDAIKTAKTATTDIDARRTWILFGDPSMKIR